MKIQNKLPIQIAEVDVMSEGWVWSFGRLEELKVAKRLDSYLLFKTTKYLECRIQHYGFPTPRFGLNRRKHYNYNSSGCFSWHAGVTGLKNLIHQFIATRARYSVVIY